MTIQIPQLWLAQLALATLRVLIIEMRNCTLEAKQGRNPPNSFESDRDSTQSDIDADFRAMLQNRYTGCALCMSQERMPIRSEHSGPHRSGRKLTFHSGPGEGGHPDPFARRIAAVIGALRQAKLTDQSQVVYTANRRGFVMICQLIAAIEQQRKRPTHMAKEKDFSIVRFSTDDLPEKDRGAIWREHFGCKVFKAEIELPPPDTALKAILAVRSVPELQLISGLYAAGRQHRTRRLIADDGNDDFILRITTSGTMIVSAAGRELHSDCGAILTNAAEVSTLNRLTLGGTTVIRIPRSILSALVIDIDDIVMRPIPRDTNPLKLLVGYANALMTDDTPVSAPELRHLVVSQLTDLVAVMLGATRDAAYIAEGRGVSAARLHAAKAYLLENSGGQNLTAADVAAHLGVTIRHVQRLFEGDGTTFSSFLVNQRLTRAYRMLCEPRFSFWEIGKIASYVGFSDLSHFGRCFRKLYGSSPREIRRADPNSKPRK